MLFFENLEVVEGYRGEALDARKKLGKVTIPGPHAGPVIIGPALGLLVLWWYCIKYKERALGWY